MKKKIPIEVVQALDNMHSYISEMDSHSNQVFNVGIKSLQMIEAFLAQEFDGVHSSFSFYELTHPESR